MHIIVLPGLDGTGKMLTGFVKVLGLNHDVEVMTYPNKNALSYEELVQIAISTLPKNQPYAIIAESFSGPIAVKIASLAGDNLKTIIFAASFIENPTIFPKFLSMFAKGAPLKSSALLRLAKPWTFGKWASRNFDTLLNEALNEVSHEVISSRIRSLMSANERTAFEAISLPMLYIQPSADRLVSKSNASKMRALNNAVQIKQVDGPHFILQTNPNDCAGSINLFLKNAV